MARRDKEAEREIALSRIARLGDLALAAARAGRVDRADRYIDLARRIAMRYKLRSPPGLAGRWCRACHAFLSPGLTARVRVRSGRVIVTCLACGHVRRRPLAPRAAG